MNVNLFFKSVSGDGNKLRFLRWDHPWLSSWTLHPMTKREDTHRGEDHVKTWAHWIYVEIYRCREGDKDI